MAVVNFFLKEPKANFETLIYLFFSYNNKRLKYSTSQKIHPKFWNDKENKVKDVRAFPKANELNALLKNIDTIISNEYRKLINEKFIPTNDKLKVVLDEFLLKAEQNNYDLIKFAEEWIEQTNRKPSTIQQLKQTIRHLKNFKAYSKRDFHFDSIDLNFYDELISFLLKKSYAKNTVGTVIKNLKVFMNEAVERGLTNNMQFKNKRFKKITEESESIYLTEIELNKIYKLNLSANEKLEKTRDLFIVGCYTGLRFSDLTKLKPENIIDNNSRIKVVTEKTGELVVIPLHPYIKEIIKKYNNELPNIISNQKMNEYIKEIGERAKLNEPISISITQGGKKVTTIYKKFELITVHTARRSFATNAYLADVPSISIMKITGHKTERNFLTYIKISQEDNANKLTNHPFFK